MTRKRKISTEYPIKYVHESNGRIVFRPYLSIRMREDLPTDKNGFLKPPIALGKVGDDPDEIYRAYLSAKESIDKQQGMKRNTIGWIIQEYMESRLFRELDVSSQKRAQNLRRIIDHPIRINGKNATLSDLHITNLSKPIMHKIAEKRLSDYQAAGKKGVVQVNRETTFISTAISWATNYMPEVGVSINPLRGYKKLKETACGRYVTDEEYAQQYELAGQIRPYLQPMIELTYLLATRGVETLDIRLSDCTSEGIRTYRRKGSKDNIIEWSDRLRNAYDVALALHKNYVITLHDPHLLCKPDGSALAKSTINAAFQELKRKMEQQGLQNAYWSLHMVKAKGISDSQDKHIAGHVTEAMRQRYDRKVPIRKPAK